MLTWRYTPYALPLFIGSGLMLMVGVLATRGSLSRGKALLAAAAALSIAYAFGYALELGSQSVEAVRLWLKLQYLGITLGPLALFGLTLHLTGLSSFAQPRRLIPLAILPLIILGLVWTSELHDFYWFSVRIDAGGPFTRTIFERNVLYYVGAGYSVFLLALTIVALVRAWWQARQTFYRRQLLLLTIAVSIPLLIYPLYLSGAVLPGLDLNPYAQVVTYLLIALGMLRHSLFDIVPVAREALINQMADPVLVLDASGRLIDLNPAAATLLQGPAAAQPQGRAIAELLPPLAELLAEQLPGQQLKIDLHLNGPQGDCFYSVSVTRLAGRSAADEGRLLLMHDITDRIRAVQQLRTLREIEAELTRKLDLHFTVMLAVDAAQRLSGADAVLLALPEGERYRIEHAIGYPCEAEGQRIASNRGIIRRVLASMQPELSLDVATDPDYIALIPGMQAQMTLPLPSRSRPAGLLVLETTDAKRFSPQVFEAIQLLAARIASAVHNALLFEERNLLLSDLDAFSHSVAHDLKAPLAVIIGYADLLLGEEGFDAGQRHSLSRIISTGFRATEIINALLLLAEARKFGEVPTNSLDMQATLQEALDNLQQTLAASGAKLTMPESPPPPVLGHHTWMVEVWTNFISNAIKYGGNPPEVNIDWETLPAQGHCRFRVRDNGRGLRPEETERLFRPFTRLDRSKEGHGLGLTIVQRIIARLQGQVGVESQPGQGSAFYFTLPLADAAGSDESLISSP